MISTKQKCKIRQRIHVRLSMLTTYLCGNTLVICRLVIVCDLNVSVIGMSGIRIPTELDIYRLALRSKSTSIEAIEIREIENDVYFVDE